MPKAKDEFTTKLGRKRVERKAPDGGREYRAHHSALGAGWLHNEVSRFDFTSDDGRVVDLGKWEEISIGRVRTLFDKRRARTAEDADYQSVLMPDGVAHEFRFEFADTQKQG